jgi:DNA-binding NarL/FixJ family response regulator
MPKRIKVLIADDHGVIREGLRMLIETEPDMQIVGEATDGKQAVALARKSKPDVVVMDAFMPVCNGVTATQRITRFVPKSRILVLSASDSAHLERQMMSAGAAGYLNKQAAPAHLLSGIRQVRQGTGWVTLHSAQDFPRIGTRPLPTKPPQGRLTAREIQVLRLLAEGCSNKRIAAELNITLATVRTHRQQITRKLNLRGVAKLTRYAMANHLTSSDSAPCLP